MKQIYSISFRRITPVYHWRSSQVMYWTSRKSEKIIRATNLKSAMLRAFLYATHHSSQGTHIRIGRVYQATLDENNQPMPQGWRLIREPRDTTHEESD